MKIELKNIKYAAFASQETYCFEATLHINGRSCGRVSNDGHGGPHYFDSHAAEDVLNTYGKTLPATTYEVNGETMTFSKSAECIVNDLLEDYLTRRELDRKMKSKVLFLQDNKLWESKPKGATTLAALIDHYVQKGTTVLNTLPKAEALALYRGAA